MPGNGLVCWFSFHPFLQALEFAHVGVRCVNVLLCTSHHNLLMDTDCFQLQKRCRAWLVNHLSDLSNLSIRKFLDCGNPSLILWPTPHLLTYGRVSHKGDFVKGAVSGDFRLLLKSGDHPDLLAFGFQGAGKQSYYHKLQEDSGWPHTHCS